MKTTSAELKQRAKLTLSGKYGIAVGASLIIGAVIMTVLFIIIGVMTFQMVSMPMDEWIERSASIGSMAGTTVLWLLCMLFVYLLMCGVRRMFYNMAAGQPYSIGDMLFAYTHKPHRFLGLYFFNMIFNLILGIPYYVVSAVSVVTGYLPVMVVLQFLMYLLQIIGVIAYSLYFGMAAYLLVEDPDRKVFGCLRESISLMKGNKGRMLYLGLSFIGMYLLGMGSFGIGFLWIYPYMETTMIYFYFDLCESRRQEAAYYQEEPAYDEGFRENAADNGIY